MFRSCLALTIALFPTTLCFPRSAIADVYTQTVGVQCKGNDAAIRFGWSDDGDPPRFNPLPPHFEQWGGVPIARSGRCKLADGGEVTARAGTEQAFGYGMGLGNPPEFFSLWISGKKVLSRQIYKDGYDKTASYLSAAFYAPGTMTLCRYQVTEENLFLVPPGMGEADPRSAKIPIACEKRNVDLAALPLDPRETPEVRAKIGTISVADGDPVFCGKFIHPKSQYQRASAQTYFRIGQPSTTGKEVLAFLPLNPEVPFADDRDGESTSTMVDGGQYAVAKFDFFSDGKIETVVRYSSETHYFDGERLFIRTQATHSQIADLVTATFEPEKVEGWRVIDGSDTEYQRKFGNMERYTHFALFRRDGKTYLLATPTNTDYTPSAMLYNPTRAGLVSVCTFQMEDENY